MDKFGIFNVLNLLLGKNEGQSANQAEKNSSLQDLVSNLLSPKNPTLPKQEQKKHDPLSVPLPLQASMVSTMTAHDKFIKRVKENNQKVSDKTR